jgi:hypothetical protein
MSPSIASVVLGLQVCELALLRTHFEIELVVVDLRDQSLERNAALHARRRRNDGRDRPWVDKGAGSSECRDVSLLEEARRMSGGRHLLDTLAEGAAAADDVRDLGLVSVDFDRARPHVVRGGVQINELCCHVFLSAVQLV